MTPDELKAALRAFDRQPALHTSVDWDGMVALLFPLIISAHAAFHALRSYQYGNSAAALAEEVANELAADLAALAKAPRVD